MGPRARASAATTDVVPHVFRSSQLYVPHDDGKFYLPPLYKAKIKVGNKDMISAGQALAMMFNEMVSAGIDEKYNGKFYWTEQCAGSKRWAGTRTERQSPDMYFVPETPTSRWREQWKTANNVKKLKMCSSEFIHNPPQTSVVPIWITGPELNTYNTRAGVGWGEGKNRSLEWPGDSSVLPKGLVIDASGSFFHATFLESFLSRTTISQAEQIRTLQIHHKIHADWLSGQAVAPIAGDVHLGLLKRVLDLGMMFPDQVIALTTAIAWPLYLKRSKIPSATRDIPPYQMQVHGPVWQRFAPKDTQQVRLREIGREKARTHVRRDYWFYLELANEFNHEYDVEVSPVAIFDYMQSLEETVEHGEDSPPSGDDGDDSADDSESDSQDEGYGTKEANFIAKCIRRYAAKQRREGATTDIAMPWQELRERAEKAFPAAYTIARSTAKDDLRNVRFKELVFKDPKLKNLIARHERRQGTSAAGSPAWMRNELETYIKKHGFRPTQAYLAERWTNSFGLNGRTQIAKMLRDNDELRAIYEKHPPVSRGGGFMKTSGRKTDKAVVFLKQQIRSHWKQFGKAPSFQWLTDRYRAELGNLSRTTITKWVRETPELSNAMKNA